MKIKKVKKKRKYVSKYPCFFGLRTTTEQKRLLDTYSSEEVRKFLDLYLPHKAPPTQEDQEDVF